MRITRRACEGLSDDEYLEGTTQLFRGTCFRFVAWPELKRISAVPRLIVGFPVIMNIPSARLKDCFTRVHPVWQPSCYNFGGKSTKSIEIVGRAGFAFYP